MNNKEVSGYERTWGKYSEIQKEYPYSDQVIDQLIARAMAAGVIPMEPKE